MQNLNNKKFDAYLINSNLTSSEVASQDFFQLVEDSIGWIAPRHLSAVTLTHFRNSLEKAIMTALAERDNKKPKVLGFSK